MNELTMDSERSPAGVENDLVTTVLARSHPLLFLYLSCFSVMQAFRPTRRYQAFIRCRAIKIILDGQMHDL
jgi:hypothetical protein